jgi:hypothetical protein
MKRIFYTSLLMMALLAQALGQGGRQLAAQNLAGVTDVTSIPLSDTLAERAKTTDARPNKTGRESSVTDADNPASGEKKRYWVRAEYLNWRIKGSYLPPLAQTFGFLTTTRAPGDVLVGGQEVNPGNSGGGRITAGMWLNQRRTIGVEASYFYLGPRSINQSAGGNGADTSPFIGRPFIPAFSGFTSTFPISFPSRARGDLTASLASHLQGAEVNGVYDVGKPGCCPLRLLAGVRFLDLKERLTIIENLVYNYIGTLGDGSEFSFIMTDEFATRNRFYGGQGGAETELTFNRLKLELSGKVAVGGVRQLVNISGSTISIDRANRQSLSLGGFLALESTNIGRYQRTRLVILPEVKASIGYQLTDNLRAFAGYDFLYLSGAARPAELIDPRINWVRVPFYRIIDHPSEPRGGPDLPAFIYSDSPFWARGLTVGLRLGF